MALFILLEGRVLSILLLPFSFLFSLFLLFNLLLFFHKPILSIIRFWVYGRDDFAAVIPVDDHRIILNRYIFINTFHVFIHGPHLEFEVIVRIF
jgi:hypothetical protein